MKSVPTNLISQRLNGVLEVDRSKQIMQVDNVNVRHFHYLYSTFIYAIKTFILSLNEVFVFPVQKIAKPTMIHQATDDWTSISDAYLFVHEAFLSAP